MATSCLLNLSAKIKTTLITILKATVVSEKHQQEKGGLKETK